MSANTKWYVTIPVVQERLITDYAVTEAEVREHYPNAIKIEHWSEREITKSSWEGDVDRQSGAYTQWEIDNATAWR